MDLLTQNIGQIIAILVSILATLGGLFVSIKKILSSGILSIQNDKIQMDMLSYIKEVQNISVQMEKECRDKLTKSLSTLETAEEKIEKLLVDNSILRTQNKGLMLIIEKLEKMLKEKPNL